MQTQQQRDKDRFEQLDVLAVLKAKHIPHPWVVAKKSISGNECGGAWFAALVPVASVPELLRDGGSWDLHIGDGAPSVWTAHREDGSTQRNYCRFGNERGIEPLVLIGNSIGSQPSPVEISQEFKLYHRLVEDRTNGKFIKVGLDSNESDAVRINDRDVEIRSDLLLQYCSAKEMALAIYVDSAVYSRFELYELGVADSRVEVSEPDFCYSLSTRDFGALGDEDKRSISRLLGKKYIMPPPPSEDEPGEEVYQEFIIDSRPTGELVRETCDPELLADYFGKNKGRPNYLTPVFFRLEVLAKYYSDPVRFEVQDGAIHCHGNWILHLDNDNDNYVCVWLGDLGRDLSESERNYWLSFNIPPDGRKISKTCYERGIRANFADPTRPDLLFKNSYKYFSRDFLKKEGWPFFLELHDADQHSFQSLHGLLSENGSEFDDQLINLAKLLVDSLNESKLVEGRSTVDKDEKGITKLEKFLVGKGFSNFEQYVDFLRKLQRLRSLSAAHRKGGNYDKANKEFGLSEDGFKRAFDGLLAQALAFVEYLRGAFGLEN